MYVQLYTTYIIVRLFGGSTRYEGTVDVYYNGDWHTVCNDEWDLNAAQVVCRQLGFGPAVTAEVDTIYREGSGEILLDKLVISCNGTELTIEDCLNSGVGILDCEDASVKCTNGNFNINTVTQHEKTELMYTKYTYSYYYVRMYICISVTV